MPVSEEEMKKLEEFSFSVDGRDEREVLS